MADNDINDTPDTTDTETTSIDAHGAAARETLGDTAAEPGNTAAKDPADWVTGDEPMTGPQKSYLNTLAHEAGEELPATLTKAEASEHIDRLQQKTGRGASE